MSKLITVYSTSSGLKISKPKLLENFYPVKFDKYITLQTGSGMAAKNYDYWGEVISLLKKYLDANQIGIVLLGAPEDFLVKHVLDLRGKTTIHQSHFIIKNALLHMGSDSCLVHIAGANNVPVVGLYGSTSIDNHGPFWKNEEKSIFLESHRFGNKPSFASQEAPKTINLIRPEEIANAVLKILNIKEDPGINSLYIGPIYNHTLIEAIPDSPFPEMFAPQSPVIIRMDYVFNEDNLFKIAKQRSVHIVSDKEINSDLIKSIKDRIIGLNLEVKEDTSPAFLALIKSLGIKTLLYTKSDDENVLSSLRFKFFDFGFIDKLNTHRLENFVNDSRRYRNDSSLDFSEKFDNMEYKSNKFIISNNKIYLSKAAWLANQPTNSVEENAQKVFNTPEFWNELEHFYIYERNNTV